MGLTKYKENPPIRENIYRILQTARPDVLCVQEFYTNEHPDQQPHLENIQRSCSYPYHYFVKHYTNWKTWHYGTVVFSRFPIVDTARIAFRGGYKNNEDLVSVKLLVHGDTVQLLTGHLSSYRLNTGDYDAVGSTDGGKIKSVMGKMRRSFANRVRQAEIMAGEVAKSKYPVIVTGDFNAIPLSYTYKTIRGGKLQDAFLEKGSGFGRTYAALSPTLRIDYVLAGKEFTVEDFSIHREKGLQHFPVMARLSLKH
nr:endonuclease/exonuclease/phosphatase family protein [Chitinophaga chungangae]